MPRFSIKNITGSPVTSVLGLVVLFASLIWVSLGKATLTEVTALVTVVAGLLLHRDGKGGNGGAAAVLGCLMILATVGCKPSQVTGLAYLKTDTSYVVKERIVTIPGDVVHDTVVVRCPDGTAPIINDQLFASFNKTQRSEKGARVNLAGKQPIGNGQGYRLVVTGGCDSLRTIIRTQELRIKELIGLQVAERSPASSNPTNEKEKPIVTIIKWTMASLLIFFIALTFWLKTR